jgi:hypothetical protein
MNMEKLLEPLNAIGEALRQSHCARSGQALVPFEALAPEMQRRLAAAVKAELDGQKSTW